VLPSEKAVNIILKWKYQCCGSGMYMFIPDPDFYPSRISDQKTATKERGENKFVIVPFFVATKIIKLKIILIRANLQRIIELSTQKIVKKLSGFWDPGSGKNLFRIPDTWFKKAPDPGSGYATLGST
jgi:hypothetical protein